jgi:hypothetical protein
LDDLRRDAKLTPARFARHFAEFRFKRHDAVQPPEVFLTTQSGDCDDYATLAATVLAERGYTTRLFAVRMPDDVHVVCYVAEANCYLDYNNRTFLIRTVRTDGSPADVARKVAKSFDASWSSVSEFTWREGRKRLLATHTHPGTARPPQLTLARP